MEEAERLLGGRLLDPVDLCRHHLPAWILVAPLAHASWNELHRMAAWKQQVPGGRWYSTIGFLAGETLNIAGDGTALLDLQRTTLVPLELRLLSGRVTSPTTPAEVVDVVTWALNTRLRPGA